MSTAEYRLFVPRHLNSGVDVSSKFFQALETRLTSINSGYTRTSALGAYKLRNNDIVREPIYVYSLLASSSNVIRGRMRSIAEHVKLLLAQESVLLQIAIVEAEFI